MPAATIQDIECGSCGASSPTMRTVANRILCPSCASRYSACSRCDSLVAHLYSTVDGDQICGRCTEQNYTECYRCDRLAPDESIHHRAEGGDLCDDCAEHYWACEGCAELICDGDRCDDCASDQDDDPIPSAVVHSYNYQPTPVFHGTGPLFFGLELEISSAYGGIEDNAEHAQRRLRGMGYLKEDSSINENSGLGFELVTHPMSYDWVMHHFPWDMLGELQQNGCNADGNGLHIHVSRAGFTTPSHVYRWMKFIYRNRRQVTTIARRDSDQWAAFRESDRQQVKSYAKGDKGHDRYCAINTLNNHTFELRMFASSLVPAEVQAALTLAAASIEYTRHLTITQIVHEDGWAWETFSHWVSEHSEYAPLLREMENLACAC